MQDNTQFPLPEENRMLPEEVIPVQGELPDITELTMQPALEEPAPTEEPVLPEEEPAPAEEEPSSEEPTAAEEEPSSEEPAPVEEEASSEETAAGDEVMSDMPAEVIPVPEEPVSEESNTEELHPEEDAAPAEDAESSPEEFDAQPLPAEEEIPAGSGEESMARIPDADPQDMPEDTDPELSQALRDIEALLDKPVDQDYRDKEPDPEFDAMLTAPAPKEEKVEHERPTRKGRPKRKKGEGLFGIPNILATFVWLALILAIGVTAGRMLWVCAADVLAFGREDKAVTITIYEADTLEDIVDKLHSNGLIRYKSLFNLYASISEAEEDIKPGIYDLNTRYDYHALVNFMSPKSSREVVELTIPEGYTCQQIFALLEENRVCTAVDAAAYAANGQLNDYWFLEGLERGSENCLEGYLFPDTYEFL